MFNTTTLFSTSTLSLLIRKLYSLDNKRNKHLSLRNLFPLRKTLYILLILNSITALSQNFSAQDHKLINHLKAKTNNDNIHDSLKVDAFLEIANHYYLKYPDSAIAFCHKAEKLAEKINYGEGKAQSYGWLGYLYKFQGKVDKALEYNFKSLKYLKKIGDKNGIGASLNNIGNIYDNQGKVPLGLEYYHKSLKIYEEIGDDSGVAFALNNIGYVHERQKDMQEALKFFIKSINVREKKPKNKRNSDDKRGLALTLNNLGNLSEQLGEREKCLHYYERSLALSTEIGDKNSMTICLLNMGLVYKHQARDTTNNYSVNAIDSLYNLSLIRINQAIEIAKETGDKLGLASSYYHLGSIEFERGNFAHAIKLADMSLKESRDLGFPENIKNSAELLFKLYEKKGNSTKALEMHKLFVKMRDRVHNDENQKATIRTQAQYEYENQKALDDAENDKRIAIEKEAKESQKKMTYFSLAAFFLVVAFLIFVFNRLKITRKQKVVIEQQKEVVELAHSELEEKNHAIMDSINYARRIQSAILPPDNVVKDYLKESFVLYKPKDIVAGDFYWLEHKDGKVLFAAADCTGHGVPGAMVSVVCNNALNRSVREYGLTEPGLILNKTREIVIQEFEKSDDDVKDGMDIALCSLEGDKLQFAGANNPLWIIRKGELLETKADKQPIGKYDNLVDYTTHTILLEKGDSIYIFSDGYVDQFGGDRGKKFMARAFRELLLSIQDKSIEEQKMAIDEAFESWRGELEQIDDVCVIGFKF